MTNDTRRDRARARARRVIPVVAVALLAAALPVADAAVRATEGALPAGEQILPGGWGWLIALLLLAQAGVLWMRDRRPRLSLALVAGLDIGTLVLSGGQLSVGSIAVIVAAYTVWRTLETRRALPALAIVGAASGIAAAVTSAVGGVVPVEWALPVAAARTLLAFAAPALVAETVRSRARLLEALRDRATLAEREQERAALDAVLQERALMARELHDIAAHHLSGIILGAQAAGALVEREPDRAAQYLRTVREEAQRTLANLRLTVGLLRPHGEGELAPVPSIDQIPDLIETVRAGGMAVEFERVGDPVPLGPIAEVAAYRAVQESLTNARVHAPGAACAVTVRYGPGAAELTVQNERPAVAAGPPGSGNGLLGMRERAALVGGTLTTGPTAAGGWRNHLVLPYPDPEGGP